ncbi:MAG: aldehyde ferredoxin oxidoreductase N-terminal domain-containing protein, partial [Syntrophomonadaceae bacterium]|nr:aldehyde ferredoxin oxidoreductase N-terminal domain-containing protein [Syntrophomonadaceae bacterium]
MTELFGWMGKILRVDLTNRIISYINTEQYVPKYIGGQGIMHRIAWEEIPKGIGAFDPRNKLMIMTGPLTGTLAPTSGRAECCSIAAQGFPEQYTHSGIGGWFPAKLKYAGFDGIIIEGMAASPCYLWVNNGEVEIKNADRLWGLGTYDTQNELKKIHGNSVSSVCIGPAGENKSRIAVIITDTENAFGQGGFGGVAGSKNLKAICVDGKKKVKIARPDELLRIRAEVSWPPENNPEREDNCFFRNFDSGSYPQKWSKKACSHSCYGSCFYEFKDVPAATRPGAFSGQIGCIAYNAIEWANEKGGSTSPLWPLWSQTFKGGFETSWLCNQYGLNNWEIYAGMVPWLVMGNRMGVITEELYGGPINPNKTEWWAEFLHRIAYREGFGDILSEGVNRAIDILGKKEFGETMYTGTRLCGMEPDPKAKTLQVNTPISLQEAWGYAEHHSGRGVHSFRSFPNWLLWALAWLTDTRDPFDNKHIKTSSTWLKEYETDPYLGEIGPAITYFNVIRGQLKSSLTLCNDAYP